MKVIFKFTKSWSCRHRLPLTLGIAAFFHVIALAIVPHPQALATVEPVRLRIIAPELVTQPQPAAPQPLAKAAHPRVTKIAQVVPPKEAQTHEPAATVMTVAEDGGGGVIAAQASVVSAGAAVPAVVKEEAAPSFADGGGAAFSGYRGALSGRVASMKRYPLQARRMHIEGVTTVRFRVARDGRLAAPPVVIGPSHPLLDQEAVRMIQAAAPFPALPQGTADVVEFSLPIHFVLES